ncbi:copper amine oxidase N-terminal domain-containing protein [Sedimentibacter hydroxybenzoicus DSM 7310]|uniref:Copper amine oxidase N-terminal domain-containing protein n=1 Tax=Sedimentibacter hydroxybenzoicus DSM 7310 TaxID=1123245 RepID=A0A974BIR4_SEDHY|nr:copper amine oxidase N-terminal domain-containing protein [Sedimentibacter hydroxybenzoicus]NYB73651.1 copper amine oxidase N-terminal domain-containing protein [Sedimentibacter hydroxybenzoicus DSM 7310]
MNKRVIKAMAAVVVILMMLSLSAAYAAGELKIFVDDVMLETEVPPVIINGRTMIPVRAVSEAADCEVQWDEEQKKISISAPHRAQPLMYMYLDNPIVNLYVYNAETMETAVDQVEADAAPVLVNGRTMVPLRFIAETMGFEVEWNEAEGAVYLGSGPELTAAGGYDDNTQFPPYAEYTEAYVLEGDPGEYISARTAALILALDILPEKYTDVNSEGKFKITLTGLSDVGGEECYMFTVEGENGDILYYVVSYTQQVTEILG